LLALGVVEAVMATVTVQVVAVLVVTGQAQLFFSKMNLTP
jgi:hypothetical protein